MICVSDRIDELVARFPTPAEDGKLAQVDAAATASALAELVQGSRLAASTLIARVTPPQEGGDTRAAHALHALVTYVCVPDREGPRRAVASALAAALDDDRPKPLKAFLIRQLQLVGTGDVVATLARFLLDEELGDPALQALLAIRPFDLGNRLCEVVPPASDRRRAALAQALGAIRDAKAIPFLKPLTTTDDREVRLAAVWALARIADPRTIDAILKAADTAAGFERIKATQACLLLAE